MLSQQAAGPKELAQRLHPRLRRWFKGTYRSFTHAQSLCVPAILDRESHSDVQCIYISPLRALAYDIEKNLTAPISGMGLEKELRVHSRTGDTTSAQRASFKRRGAHVLVTTPESLAVMLAQEAYREHLRSTEFVIIDELPEGDRSVAPPFVVLGFRRRRPRSICSPSFSSASGGAAASPRRRSRNDRSWKSSRPSVAIHTRRPATRERGSTRNSRT